MPRTESLTLQYIGRHSSLLMSRLVEEQLDYWIRWATPVHPIRTMTSPCCIFGSHGRRCKRRSQR